MNLEDYISEERLKIYENGRYRLAAAKAVAEHPDHVVGLFIQVVAE